VIFHFAHLIYLSCAKSHLLKRQTKLHISFFLKKCLSTRELLWTVLTRTYFKLVEKVHTVLCFTKPEKHQTRREPSKGTATGSWCPEDVALRKSSNNLLECTEASSNIMCFFARTSEHCRPQDRILIMFLQKRNLTLRRQNVFRFVSV
jgi:hypothetical protein